MGDSGPDTKTRYGGSVYPRSSIRSGMDNERSRGILGLGMVSHSGIHRGKARRSAFLLWQLSGGVDDAYQLFDNGVLVGSWGKFSWARQTADSLFHASRDVPSLPQYRSAAEPGTGSIESGAPVTEGAGIPRLDGTRAAFASSLHRRVPLRPQCWARLAQLRKRIIRNVLELIQEYAFSGILGGPLLLLAIVAASLIIFDRSDRVYLWVAAALLLAALRECVFSLAKTGLN